MTGEFSGSSQPRQHHAYPPFSTMAVAFHAFCDLLLVPEGQTGKFPLTSPGAFPCGVMVVAFTLHSCMIAIQHQATAQSMQKEPGKEICRLFCSVGPLFMTVRALMQTGHNANSITAIFSVCGTRSKVNCSTLIIPEMKACVCTLSRAECALLVVRSFSTNCFKPFKSTH